MVVNVEENLEKVHEKFLRWYAEEKPVDSLHVERDLQNGMETLQCREAPGHAVGPDSIPSVPGLFPDVAFQFRREGDWVWPH